MNHEREDFTNIGTPILNTPLINALRDPEHTPEAKQTAVEQLARGIEELPQKVEDETLADAKDGRIKRLVTYASLSIGVGVFSEALKIAKATLEHMDEGDRASEVLIQAYQGASLYDVLTVAIPTGAIIALVRNKSYQEGLKDGIGNFREGINNLRGDVIESLSGNINIEPIENIATNPEDFAEG